MTQHDFTKNNLEIILFALLHMFYTEIAVCSFYHDNSWRKYSFALYGPISIKIEINASSGTMVRTSSETPI